MTQPKIKFSIQSIFLWAVMIVASTTLLISSVVSIRTQIKGYQQEQIEDASMLAEMIAINTANTVDEKALGDTNNELNSLYAADFVTHVHLYKFDETGELARFTTFNQSGNSSIPDQIDRLSRFYTPQITDDAIEVARPINVGERTIGYVYLRASAESIDEMFSSLIMHQLLFSVIILAACLLVAFRTVHYVNSPINALTGLLQRIARSRDYSPRAEPSNIRDVNALSDAINSMLSRMQDYMLRQQRAEEQHRNLNASLEDMVNQRTIALKDANQELIQTLEKLHQFQRQIVQNEKMASLGDMVAGVAHEVNTPIGLGVTASTMMLDRLATIKEQFENKTLKASAMAKFMAESEENLNIIYRNLNRAAELISSFKQVAVDQSNENARVLDLAQLISEILLSLRPRLKKVNHKIDVQCESGLIIETKAGPINQILINLIMNSIIHGFEGIENGNIEIVAEIMNSSKLKLIYRDNGKGIPSAIRKRIFDPFVTTKRGQGGSGLGMHLVYNLVTQGLNGSISLTSEEGQGVEFMIIFPVKVKNSA